jgi:hypothetical protein
LAGIADAEYKAVSYAQYSQKTLVNYMLGKTFLSAFSWFNSLFLITFSIIALFNGYDVLGVVDG